MKTKLFFVNCLISFLFAAACGGDNGGPAKPDGGNKDCNNNNKCEVGENCGNCLADCPCQEGMKCESGECVSALCGNGQCDEVLGEKCGSCLADCPCPEDRKCGQSGACVYLTCGDEKGECDPWEDCTCVEDCPCPSSAKCKDGVCVYAECGDGECWPVENCRDCLADCPCPAGKRCNEDGSCVAPECGDEICEADENCANCVADCPCPEGKTCEAGECVFDQPPTCPNGTCEEWEHCGNCPSDCACPETAVCNEMGTCSHICPDPEHPPEICKPKAALDAVCDSDGRGGLQCWRGFYQGQSCATNADCQDAPLDQYPPCVCWDFCGFAKNSWQCGLRILTFILEDNGNGYCKISDSVASEITAYGKPGSGGNYAQRPPEGEPEYVLKINEVGNLVLNSDTECQLVNE